jgi:hypothetical protein
MGWPDITRPRRREHTRVDGHRLVRRKHLRGENFALRVLLNGRRLAPVDLRHLSPTVIQIIGGHQGDVEVYERDFWSSWEPDAGLELRRITRK